MAHFGPERWLNLSGIIRYEMGSTIVTTNRSFEDWGQLFGDKVMASAIIDRLVHHAFIIKIKGESYRVKNTEKTENK